ncbi:MAG: radical SAM protein [Alphaproteobacteria bacterium]
MNDRPANMPINHFALAPEKNTFATVHVDLTHRCNMECANCYVPNRDIPDMDSRRLFDVLAKLPRRTDIRLMGGEPTLRLDLPEIIREVVRHGHRPVLATNGLKLAHLDYCRMLKVAGLRYVLLSMNGADDDDVYRVIDSGKYAVLKTRALKNCLEVGFRLNTGTIIAKGVNEHTLQAQIDLVVRTARELGINFDRDRPWSRVTPILRMRSVGAIGRYMPDSSCSYDEMVRLLAAALDRPIEQILQRSMTPGRVLLELEDDGGERSALVPVETEAGKVLVRLVDWSTDEAGVPDAGNPHRGRLTSDFRIAPFFEDIKANEFGY